MKKAARSLLKEIRELSRQKTARDESGLFVAEGEKIVRDAAAKGHDIKTVVVSSGFLSDASDLPAHLEKRGISVFDVSTSDFDRISTLKNPGGILAIIQKKPYTIKFLHELQSALVVLCDGVQDPGNLGSIIRNSVAFGADCLLLTGSSADVYNPKTVRSSSGTVMDIPVIPCSYKDLDILKKDGYRILTGHIDRSAGTDIRDIKKIPRLVILAFGSEGAGISGEVYTRSDGFFHIGISGKVESLNVTSALTISLYELKGR